MPLRQCCPASHTQVIWYDAVTVEGCLDWQNCVTPLNQPFFDACDAIFVNYSWAESGPVDIAAHVGSRRTHVFMGVDVFGRGTFGGGGMNCRVALDAIQAAGDLGGPAFVSSTLKGGYCT